MSSMNCRSVRNEIEEAAPGKWLSSHVMNHVADCGACETLLREQTKLRELVSSLGTVTAPGDFDFRLRARLAEEKRLRTSSFAFGSFSFGLGSAAVVALLLIGSALMFVSFRNRPNPELTASGTNVGVTRETVTTSATGAASGEQADNAEVIDASINSTGSRNQSLPMRRTGLAPSQIASRQDGSRQKTLDSSSTLAPTYALSSFPIDSGYQSLKVSVDDGRGTSRTISLPTVSFGSQSSLSQGASPLMVSARGAW